MEKKFSLRSSANMRWNLLNVIFFCFAISILMGIRCNKYDFPERNLKYDFGQSISLSPYSKQYHIGDTIWVSLNTPFKILYDQRSSQQIGADSFLLQFGINMVKRFPISPYTDPSAYCDFVILSSLNPVFSNYSTGFLAYFNFGCDNNPGFTFKLGIVVKGAGTFSLNLSDRKEIGLCTPNSSTNVTYSQVGYTFNLNDCNKDIYLSIPSSARGNMSSIYEEMIDKKQFFVFEVQ
jgi:hypothetical protein